MADLFLESGKKAGMNDVAQWWLEHYEGIEHMTEGAAISPETWYTINTILRRCFNRFTSKPTTRNKTNDGGTTFTMPVGELPDLRNPAPTPNKDKESK